MNRNLFAQTKTCLLLFVLGVIRTHFDFRCDSEDGFLLASTSLWVESRVASPALHIRLMALFSAGSPRIHVRHIRPRRDTRHEAAKCIEWRIRGHRDAQHAGGAKDSPAERPSALYVGPKNNHPNIYQNMVLTWALGCH